jgi:hypothetical protein
MPVHPSTFHHHDPQHAISTQPPPDERDVAAALMVNALTMEPPASTLQEADRVSSAAVSTGSASAVGSRLLKQPIPFPLGSTCPTAIADPLACAVASLHPASPVADFAAGTAPPSKSVTSVPTAPRTDLLPPSPTWTLEAQVAQFEKMLNMSRALPLAEQDPLAAFNLVVMAMAHIRSTVQNAVPGASAAAILPPPAPASRPLLERQPMPFSPGITCPTSIAALPHPASLVAAFVPGTAPAPKPGVRITETLARPRSPQDLPRPPRPPLPVGAVPSAPRQPVSVGRSHTLPPVSPPAVNDVVHVVWPAAQESAARQDDPQGVRPPPVRNVVDRQLLWIADVDDTSAASHDFATSPQRPLLGRVYAYLVPNKPNVLGLGVSDANHKSTDTLWQIFRAVLANTAPDVWARHSKLQVDAWFHIHYPLAVAIQTVLQLPNPFHSLNESVPQDVDMALILGLKSAYGEQARGDGSPQSPYPLP